MISIDIISIICLVGLLGSLSVMGYMIKEARIEEETPPVIVSDAGDEVEHIYECTCITHAQRKFCKTDCTAK